MTLSDLPAAYAAARAEASAHALGVVEDLPPNTCRYCGKHLSPWPDKPIDGHARCLIPLSFQRAIYDLWRHDVTATQKRIAEACGVSMATVERWRRNVERKGRAA